MIKKKIDWKRVEERIEYFKKEFFPSVLSTTEEIYAVVIIAAEEIGKMSYGVGGQKDIIIDLQNILLDYSTETHTEEKMFDVLVSAYGKENAEAFYDGFKRSLIIHNKKHVF